MTEEKAGDYCFECGQYSVQWWLCQNTDCSHVYTEDEYDEKLRKFIKSNKPFMKKSYYKGPSADG